MFVKLSFSTLRRARHFVNTQVTLTLMGHRVPLLFAYIRLELSPSNNNVFEHQESHFYDYGMCT